MKVAKQLILVEVAKDAKQVKDDKTGVTLLKWRHVFMTPEGTELIGWSDNDAYRADVTPTLEYDPKLSKKFLFDSKMWDGVEKLRLVDKGVADAFLKTLKSK